MQFGSFWNLPHQSSNSVWKGAAVQRHSIPLRKACLGDNFEIVRIRQSRFREHLEQSHSVQAQLVLWLYRWKSIAILEGGMLEKFRVP